MGSLESFSTNIMSEIIIYVDHKFLVEYEEWINKYCEKYLSDEVRD